MKIKKDILVSSLFVVLMIAIGTNIDLIKSFAMSLNAGGTNEDLSLNPTGTGKVVIGGDSIIVASKSADLASARKGQAYFNTTLNQFRGYTGSSWVNFGTSSLLSGLISFWKFDENAGSALDSDGLNHLTNYDGASFTTGKINNAIDLESGSTQYASASSGLGLSGDFSVSMWVKSEGEPTGGADVYLASEYDGSVGAEGVGWWMRYTDQTGGVYSLYVWFSDSTGNNRSFRRFNYTLGTGWNHIVATADVSEQASGITLYVNGSSVSATTSTNGATSLGNPNYEFELGARSKTATWDGLIDEVSIWPRVLSANEVTELYNSGSGVSHPF